MHPLFKKHPKLLGFANFVSKWLLLAEGMVGVVDIAQNLREITASPLGILTAFNHKNDLITNHIASIAAVSAVALFFFFEGGFTYEGSFEKMVWVALIIGIHENIWWVTDFFFVHGVEPLKFLYFAAFNYPMFMLVFYILAFGWGKRETILTVLMGVYYVVWAWMGFHITSDVLGNTIWVTNIPTNVTESLSWIYICIFGILTYYLWHRTKKKAARSDAIT